MTAGEIITKVDALEPNQYTLPQKLEWLSDLDGRVWLEIILTHERDEDDQREDFTGHTADTDELLIPWPYGREIYENYLQAKIAEENGETDRYNQQAILYNAAWQAYANAYNRSHRPAGRRTLRGGCVGSDALCRGHRRKQFRRAGRGGNR